MSFSSKNPAPPKKVLSNSNVSNVRPPTAPVLPDPDTSFLEMVLEAHEATPMKGINVHHIRAFLRMRYQLPEPVIDQMLAFTLKFAVDSQLLVKVGGRKAEPTSWSTRLNPAFILILLRRLREEAKTLLSAAEAAPAGGSGLKRKADDGEGAGGKTARV